MGLDWPRGSQEVRWVCSTMPPGVNQGGVHQGQPLGAGGKQGEGSRQVTVRTEGPERHRDSSGATGLVWRGDKGD